MDIDGWADALRDLPTRGLMSNMTGSRDKSAKSSDLDAPIHLCLHDVDPSVVVKGESTRDLLQRFRGLMKKNVVSGRTSAAQVPEQKDSQVPQKRPLSDITGDTSREQNSRSANARRS
jgi:hypothetical protein